MNHKSLTYTLEHRLRLLKENLVNLHHRVSELLVHPSTVLKTPLKRAIINSIALGIGLYSLCSPNQSYASGEGFNRDKNTFKPYVASVCEKWSKTKTLVACTLYHESRSEFKDTQYKVPLAIGFVILNRGYYQDKTIKQVITQPSQFSWYNTKATRPVKIDNKIDEENWKEAKQLADVVMKISTFPRGVQEYLDPTKGADHFWTKGVDKKQTQMYALLYKMSLGSFKFYKS